MVFGQRIKEKTMKKKQDFLNVLLLDFAILPRIPIQTAGPHKIANNPSEGPQTGVESGRRRGGGGGGREKNRKIVFFTVFSINPWPKPV